MKPTTINKAPQSGGIPYTRQRPQLTGTTLASLKKHYGLAPILIFAGLGVSIGILSIIHTLKGPEIEINRRKNPEPWNEFETKQHKLLSVGRDYSQPSPVPKY